MHDCREGSFIPEMSDARYAYADYRVGDPIPPKKTQGFSVKKLYPDSLGNCSTFLYTAAALANPDAVELLLELGAHPDKGNSRGGTPLFAAIYSGSADCVDLLLKAGADPNLKGLGQPTLDAAFFAQSDEIGRLLLRAGAVITPFYEQRQQDTFAEWIESIQR